MTDMTTTQRHIPGLSVRTLLVLALFAFVLPLGAQNLLEDNPHARRARDLRAQAAQAIENGQYDLSIEYAQEARKEREQAVTWAEGQVWAYRANSMRNRALEQMAYADRIDAATHYPKEFQLARTTMEEAEADYSAKQYEQSVPKFRLVRDTISPLKPVRPATATLPRYYVVRLIPEDRDTFNKIAGYDFVYGDRTKWRPLYEANRSILHDPNNPHLIHPGMRFEIPSLEGEKRSGTWQPK
jgi:nucleoid-associated protein YgaU